MEKGDEVKDFKIGDKVRMIERQCGQAVMGHSRQKLYQR